MSPPERPECPRQAATRCGCGPPARRPSPPSTVRCRCGLRRRRSAHPRPRQERVVIPPTHDLRWRRLEAIVPHSAECPERLAVALLLADGHIVARHEAPRVALVQHLDARQPLDVGHAVPAGRDQATGKPCSGAAARRSSRSRAVARVERFAERHAARELLGDRRIAGCPLRRLDHARQHHHSRFPCCRGLCRCRNGPRRRPRRPSQRTCSRSTGASGVPAQRAVPMPPVNNGKAVVARALEREGATSRRGRARSSGECQ